MNFIVICVLCNVVAREALCVGKPSLSIEPTGQSPIGKYPAAPTGRTVTDPTDVSQLAPSTVSSQPDKPELDEDEGCVTVRDSPTRSRSKKRKVGNKKRKNRKRKRKNRKSKKICSTTRPSLTNFGTYGRASVHSRGRPRTTINPLHGM